MRSLLLSPILPVLNDGPEEIEHSAPSFVRAQVFEPMSTLEESIANLEKEFRSRDPYQSGVVSRSEFTFVLVRNGGMLTQIDALADRFATVTGEVARDGGQRSPPMVGASSSVDYRRFMGHMRALADGRDGTDDAQPSPPPTRRDLSPELESNHDHQGQHSGRVTQAETHNRWGKSPSSSYHHAASAAKEAAAAAHHAMWSSPAPPSPTPGVAAAVDTAHQTCYDRMEEVALRSSSTAHSAAAAATTRSRVAESNTNRKVTSHDASNQVSPVPPASAPSTSSPRSTDAVAHPVRSDPMPLPRKATVHISLREVFRIIQSRSGDNRNETIRIVDAYAAFRDAGVPGVSLPQLEALCDGIASGSQYFDDDDEDASPRITAEELCTLVSRLPPKTIAAIRLTATWDQQSKRHEDADVDVVLGTPPPVAPRQSSSVTMNHQPPAAAVADKTATGPDLTMTPQETSRALQFLPPPNRSANSEFVELSSPPVHTLATYAGGRSSDALGDGTPGVASQPPTVPTPQSSSRRGSYAARQRAQQALQQHPLTSVEASSEDEAMPIDDGARPPQSMDTTEATAPPACIAPVEPYPAGTSRFQQPTKSSVLKLKRGGQHPRGAMGSASATVSERGSSRATSRPSSARSSRTSSPAVSTRSGAIVGTAPRRPHDTHPLVAVERISIAPPRSLNSGLQPHSDKHNDVRQHMRPLPWDARASSSIADRTPHISSGHASDRHRRGPLTLPTSRSSRSTSGEEGRQSSVPVSTAAVELSPMSPHHGGTPTGDEALERHHPAGLSGGSGLPGRLVEALGGRCNHVMSLCGNVDRTQSGLVRAGQITAILLALAPGIAAHELRAMIASYRRGAQRPMNSDTREEDMYDYVQLVGDLIIAGTPQREADARSPQAAIPSMPRMWDARGHNEPQQQVSSPWSEKSPTPQPRQPLGYRAVNPSNVDDSYVAKGVSAPSVVAGTVARRSVSTSPKPIQMIPTMRRSSPSPSLERGASLEHLPLEERVRIGRERIKRLLKQELLNAANYDVHTVLECFNAVDVGRRGYVDEREFRHAMVELFRLGHRQLPKWAMDRAVKVAKRPFELLEVQSDTCASLSATEKGSRSAAQRYVSMLPSNRASALAAATCDYKFLLSELELAVY